MKSAPKEMWDHFLSGAPIDNNKKGSFQTSLLNDFCTARFILKPRNEKICEHSILSNYRTKICVVGHFKFVFISWNVCNVNCSIDFKIVTISVFLNLGTAKLI